MSGIFISYRREDSAGFAGRLADDLKECFAPDMVFMDVTNIAPGLDFRKVIEQKVGACDVLLAVIGKSWLNCRGADNQPRLKDKGDFVHLELASALKRDIPVVPVLVDGAAMPPAGDLPASLEALAWRNAVELRHAQWKADLQGLATALRAMVPTDVQSPGGESKKVAPAAKRRLPWKLIASLAAILAIAVLAITQLLPARKGDDQPTRAKSATPAIVTDGERGYTAAPHTSMPPVSQATTERDVRLSADNKDAPKSEPTKHEVTRPAAAKPGFIEFDMGTLDFGTQTLGKRTARKVTATNTGGAPVTIGEFRVGAETRDFATIDGECVGKTLQPGGRCAINVYFAPKGSGPSLSSLTTIDSDGKSHTGVVLSGTGGTPAAPVEVEAPPAGPTPGTAGSGPPAPRQVNPPDKWTLPDSRMVTLEWAPVGKTLGCIVEIDCYQCCEKGKWCTDIGRGWKQERIAAFIHTTSLRLDRGQDWRWRVSAVDATGAQGEKSPWRYVFDGNK